MFRRVKASQWSDFFLPLSQRPEKGVYFYRLNQYSNEADTFIQKYLKEARSKGSVILGRLANPDEKQLSYYSEIMGMEFQMDKKFLEERMQKWLPRLNPRERESVVESMYAVLEQLRAQGKNDNMLKNAYIKFMCWFYYKLELLLKDLGQDQVPKILYEGTVSSYELLLLGIIAQAGCDILLLQYEGDGPYLKLDPQSKESSELVVPEGNTFPAGYSILELQKRAQQKASLSVLYDEKQTRRAATNTWLTGEVKKDSLKPYPERGTEGDLYNLFVQLRGVEDKTSYNSDLMHWKMDLEKMGRKVILFEQIQPPTPQEIAGVNRNNYNNINQLLTDLASKVKTTIDKGLEQQARRGFVEVIEEEMTVEAGNLNRVKNKAIYLICWFERYVKQLFDGYTRTKELNTVIFFGTVKTSFEAVFLKFLSYLPLDVLVIDPDLSTEGVLHDSRLFEQKYAGSMVLEHFPTDPGQASFGTAAYHAEQELTDIMYQDSGIYRNQQYQKAKSLSLQTMYEELYLLWDQEVKYRPNFEVIGDTVMLPVMFEKIAGVKDENVENYWSDIKKLMVEDTLVVKGVKLLDDYIHITSQTPVSFLKNRKLDRQAIFSNSSYQYGIFRQETQDHILDKLQELLDSGWVKGTYSQGVEYKVISVVLNLDKEITRLIQKMDFTRKVPKLVLIATLEQVISLEGTILLAFLHLVGFDIAVFVPTGYQVIEKYFEKPVFVEHQIGNYMYDLAIPEFRKTSEVTKIRESFINKIFKRGR